LTLYFLFAAVDLYLSPFFFNAPPTTEIYTLSLHDALPICTASAARHGSRSRSRLRSAEPGRGADEMQARPRPMAAPRSVTGDEGDRKSTRLNSSHVEISYAVFCLKKKKNKKTKQKVRNMVV